MAAVHASRWPLRTPRESSISARPERATSTVAICGTASGHELVDEHEPAPDRRGDRRHDVDQAGEEQHAGADPADPPVAAGRRSHLRWPRHRHRTQDTTDQGTRSNRACGLTPARPTLDAMADPQTMLAARGGPGDGGGVRPRGGRRRPRRSARPATRLRRLPGQLRHGPRQAPRAPAPRARRRRRRPSSTSAACASGSRSPARGS